MASNVYSLLTGTLSERPTTAEEGRCYYSYDERLFSCYLSGKWIDQEPPLDHPPYHTPAEIDALINGITSLAKARTFLKLLVKYVTVKK